MHADRRVAFGAVLASTFLGVVGLAFIFAPAPLQDINPVWRFLVAAAALGLAAIFALVVLRSVARHYSSHMVRSVRSEVARWDAAQVSLLELGHSLNRLQERLASVERQLAAVADEGRWARARIRSLGRSNAKIDAGISKLSGHLENFAAETTAIRAEIGSELNHTRQSIGTASRELLGGLNRAEKRVVVAVEGHAATQGDLLNVILASQRKSVAELTSSVSEFERHLGRVASSTVKTAARAADIAKTARSHSATGALVIGKLSRRLSRFDTGATHDNPGNTEASIARLEQRIRAQIDASATNVVQETESLLQLLPRVASSEVSLPHLGGWAVPPSGILFLADLIRSHEPKLILELGSGSSTVWIPSLFGEKTPRLVSVEHSAQYFEQTAESLGLHKLGENVELRQVPLREVEVGGEKYDWYDPKSFDDLRNIDILIVDGPPKSVGRLSRMPALPKLMERLSESALVFLDDAHRPDEKETIALWQTAYPRLRRRPSPSDRFALFSLDGA